MTAIPGKIDDASISDDPEGPNASSRERNSFHSTLQSGLRPCLSRALPPLAILRPLPSVGQAGRFFCPCGIIHVNFRQH